MHAKIDALFSFPSKVWLSSLRIKPDFSAFVFPLNFSTHSSVCEQYKFIYCLYQNYDDGDDVDNTDDDDDLDNNNNDDDDIKKGSSEEA